MLCVAMNVVLLLDCGFNVCVVSRRHRHELATRVVGKKKKIGRMLFVLLILKLPR
jgi:hypothetical protein